VTPKDIAAKRGDFASDDRSTVVQSFTPISVTVAEISITGQILRNVQRITADWIHQTKRTLALRLSIIITERTSTAIAREVEMQWLTLVAASPVDARFTRTLSIDGITRHIRRVVDDQSTSRVAITCCNMTSSTWVFTDLPLRYSSWCLEIKLIIHDFTAVNWKYTTWVDSSQTAGWTETPLGMSDGSSEPRSHY